MDFTQWIQQQAVAYVVYGLALVAMAFLILFVCSKLFFRGTKNDRLEYLKNFKKGQFAIIYVIAIPLYFFAYLSINQVNGGRDVFQYFLNAITATIKLVKLDFSFKEIAEAMGNVFFCVTLLTCYAITILNVLLFSASLVWKRLHNSIGKFCARFSKNLYIVVGANDKKHSFVKLA